MGGIDEYVAVYNVRDWKEMSGGQLRKTLGWGEQEDDDDFLFDWLLWIFLQTHYASFAKKYEAKFIFSGSPLYILLHPFSKFQDPSWLCVREQFVPLGILIIILRTRPQYNIINNVYYFEVYTECGVQ